MADIILDPNQDGITHINIYSKSRCMLGKFLSHFSRTPFEHPTLGRFESMEALWYFAKTGYQHEELRGLWGYEAKRQGQQYATVHDDNFLKVIHEGNRAKIEAYPRQLEAFKKNKLPFTHYYVFGKATWDNGVPTWIGEYKVQDASNGSALVCFWETLKTEYDFESI
ncbi:putative N-glycosidase [Serratia phage BUCT660]|uniref:Putative N-glycosidase n=1 Tax=Serratia phage vB_SmaM_Yaphecito TaxID=2777368 RepID=A0A7T3NC49_9CAUD|nr:putative N-glycosidase [Serratia phage vB_SmaM_Yaphecito]UCR74740.1 putative N-glycosidase [Serratia phage BUCT660]